MRFPVLITTTEELGKAMIYLVRYGGPKTIFENVDINQLMPQTVA